MAIKGYYDNPNEATSVNEGDYLGIQQGATLADMKKVKKQTLFKPTDDAIVELESRATDLENSDVTLNGKIDAHEADTTNPHEVTKEQVGLDEVDNTADVDKPVSTAQQTALNNKADKDTDAVVGNFAYFDAEGNPVDSGKKDADYEDADATILKEADVVDSLESTSTTAPLSANQGKVLNDAIGEVEGRVEDAEDDITAIKGVGYTEGTLKSHEDRLGTLEGADTIEGSVAKTVKDAVDPIIEDVSDHETRIEALEDEPNQGGEGKSAYDIYVETTSDSPVKTEEQWLASLKGADGDDGKSAYEYATDGGFLGDEEEFNTYLSNIGDIHEVLDLIIVSYEEEGE